MSADQSPCPLVVRPARCPHCGGQMLHEVDLDRDRDSCLLCGRGGIEHETPFERRTREETERLRATRECAGRAAPGRPPKGQEQRPNPHTDARTVAYRHAEVLRLTAIGWTAMEIAIELGIARGSVNQIRWAAGVHVMPSRGGKNRCDAAPA